MAKNKPKYLNDEDMDFDEDWDDTNYFFKKDDWNKKKIGDKE